MRVVECSPVLGNYTARRVPGSAWPEQRLFRFESFDAYEYNEADEKGRLEALAPQRTKYLWRPSARRLAQSAYDTKEGVALLDNVQCGSCGGRVPKVACRCAKDTRTGTKAAASC